MNQHAPSDILHIKDHSANRFVESVEDHFYGSKDPKLEDIALAKYGSKGNDHGCCSKVTQN